MFMEFFVYEKLFGSQFFVRLAAHRLIEKMIEEEVEGATDKIEAEVEVEDLEHLARQKEVAGEHHQNEEYLSRIFLLK